MSSTESRMREIRKSGLTSRRPETTYGSLTEGQSESDGIATGPYQHRAGLLTLRSGNCTFRVMCVLQQFTVTGLVSIMPRRFLSLLRMLVTDVGPCG